MQGMETTSHTPDEPSAGHYDLAASAVLDKIMQVMHPSYLDGKIVPAAVGYPDRIRIGAIQRILDTYTANQAPDILAAAKETSAVVAEALAYLDPGVITGYRPDDREKLGDRPYAAGRELTKWEQGHGHDIRSKCYPEFGCAAIESYSMELVQKLVRQLDPTIAR
jgi:hypothetical protein